MRRCRPCGSAGSLALVGDHKQLPPVEDDALYGIVEIDPALEDLVNRSLFEQCWDGGLPADAQCLLTIQHRMHPDIAAYVSAASYDNQLENAPEVEAYDYITRKPFPVALHFVDTEGMRGGRERRGPGGALRNEAEVRVAAQVVRLLDERCPRELSMAVIAMYAEQVERLRQALGRRKFKRTVKIDTVDLFEGREEDIVVISLVRSNERGRIGFLRVPEPPQRRNLARASAWSRASVTARLCCAAVMESMYGALVEASRSTGGWLSALELVSQPKPNRGQSRPQQEGGATVESGDGTDPERAAKRRRRRRRGRRGFRSPVGRRNDGRAALPPSPHPTSGKAQPLGRDSAQTPSPPAPRGAGRGAAAGLPTAEGSDERVPTDSRPLPLSRSRTWHRPPPVTHRRAEPHERRSHRLLPPRRSRVGGDTPLPRSARHCLHKARCPQ